MYRRKIVKLAKRIDSLLPEYAGTEAEDVLKGASVELWGLLDEGIKSNGTGRSGAPSDTGDSSDS